MVCSSSSCPHQPNTLNRHFILFIFISLRTQLYILIAFIGYLFIYLLSVVFICRVYIFLSLSLECMHIHPLKSKLMMKGHSHFEITKIYIISVLCKKNIELLEWNQNFLSATWIILTYLYKIFPCWWKIIGNNDTRMELNSFHRVLLREESFFTSKHKNFIISPFIHIRSFF